MRLFTKVASLLLLLLALSSINSFQAPRYRSTGGTPHYASGQVRCRPTYSSLSDRGNTGPSGKLHLGLPPPSSTKGTRVLARSIRARKQDTRLSMASSDGEVSEEDDKTAKKVEGRRKRVIVGYRLAFAIYALLSLGLIVPGLVKPSFLPRALNYATGPVLAAGTAYILAGAADHDRLGSDTYKRLNLVLSKFGLLWLVAGLLARQTQPVTRAAQIVSNPLVAIASLSALINGIKGWAYGAKGWAKDADTTFFKELVNDLRGSLKLLGSPVQNSQAGIFLGATLTAVGLKVIKLVDIVQAIQNKSTAVLVAFHLITLAKISMLGAMSLTLMDAANRDRLKGTTFIQLNFLTGFVWLGMGGYVYMAGEATKATLFAAFAAFSLVTGATFQSLKKQT